MTNSAGITPLGDRAIVRVHKVESKTSGGIILPREYVDKTEMAQLKATLIENGEIVDQKLNVWPVEGDVVLISKYAGLIFTGEDGEEYRIVRADDIVGVVQ